MLDPIMNDVSPIIDREAQRAKDTHGSGYASEHEAYGVLAEEVQEGWEEAELTAQQLAYLLNAIRADDRSAIFDKLRRTQRHATKACCEYIQVAAVCKKAMDWLGGTANAENS